jgi:cytochrome P450
MSTTDLWIKVEKSKHIAGAYTVPNILRYDEYIDHTFRLFFHWLDIYAEDTRPMDVDKYISFATFDVIGEIIISKSFGFLQQGEHIGNAISYSLALNVYVAVAGYFRWINIALLANPLMTSLSFPRMGHLFNMTKSLLEQREKNMSARFDAFQYWFKQDEKYPQKLTIRDIGTQALAAVGAGPDTVAAGIQAFIYHMILHRDAWDRAYDEIKAASQEGLCKDLVVSFADSQQLRYMTHPVGLQLT